MGFPSGIIFNAADKAGFGKDHFRAVPPDVLTSIGRS